MTIAATPKCTARSTTSNAKSNCATRTSTSQAATSNTTSPCKGRSQPKTARRNHHAKDCMTRSRPGQFPRRRRGEDFLGRDKSVQAAIHQNVKGMVVDGDEMFKTIDQGISDRDGQAAGREYRDLKNFATQNWARMTPKAKQVFRAYERQVMDARANGKTGLNDNQIGAFRHEAFMERNDLFQGYQDASVGGAMMGLSMKQGTISGEDLFNALGSARDGDGQAFGREFDDVAQFADQNWHRMDAGARAVFGIYEKEANAARSRGETGASLSDIRRIASDMQSQLFLLGLGEMARYQSIRG